MKKLPLLLALFLVSASFAEVRDTVNFTYYNGKKRSKPLSDEECFKHPGGISFLFQCYNYAPKNESLDSKVARLRYKADLAREYSEHLNNQVKRHQ